MTIGDFLDYCIDAGLLTVEIYSLEVGETVWTGWGDEMPNEYLDSELGSFDIPSKQGILTLNIE